MELNAPLSAPLNLNAPLRMVGEWFLNPVSVNPTKWSNTLKATGYKFNKKPVLVTFVCLNPAGIPSFPDNFIEFSEVCEAVIPQNFFSSMPMYYN